MQHPSTVIGSNASPDLHAKVCLPLSVVVPYRCFLRRRRLLTLFPTSPPLLLSSSSPLLSSPLHISHLIPHGVFSFTSPLPQGRSPRDLQHLLQTGLHHLRRPCRSHRHPLRRYRRQAQMAPQRAVHRALCYLPGTPWTCKHRTRLQSSTRAVWFPLLYLRLSPLEVLEQNIQPSVTLF